MLFCFLLSPLPVINVMYVYTLCVAVVPIRTIMPSSSRTILTSKLYGFIQKPWPTTVHQVLTQWKRQSVGAFRYNLDILLFFFFWRACNSTFNRSAAGHAPQVCSAKQNVATSAEGEWPPKNPKKMKKEGGGGNMRKCGCWRLRSRWVRSISLIRLHGCNVSQQHNCELRISYVQPDCNDQSSAAA